jgi:tyrosyl-DNA phosphodiesterase 2
MPSRSDPHHSRLDSRICKSPAAFFVTDAEDDASFEGVPFTTMTLLARKRFFTAGHDSHQEGDKVEGGDKLMLGPVSRITLPSKDKKNALCIDVVSPTMSDSFYRLINVHMESRLAVSRYHAEQVHTLANVIREPRCSGGVLAGTFNAMQLDDHQLPDKNGLTDAWVALHGTSASGGDTWNVGVIHWEGIGGHRLDKVAMMGVWILSLQGPHPIQPSVSSTYISTRYGTR